MKKKIVTIITALFIIAGAFSAYKILGPVVSTPNGEFIYIKTGSGYSDIKQELVSKRFIKNGDWFDLVSKILRYKTAKAGRYKVKKGMSLFSLVRMLKNGTQKPVNLVIIKIRTKEPLSAKTGRNIEF